jgi:aspartate carbamoyltransferase catalytic subunit
MPLDRKDILDIASLSTEEIQLILDTAESMRDISERPIKKVPVLRGKTVILFFYEPSTRTRLSFDLAAKRLSADTLAISTDMSSLVKGETLLDTARNLESMRPDVVILRHAFSGAPHFLAKRLKASVINAGDGTHAHPSQALLDMLTVRQHKGRLSGLKIAIVGDITHSRVARSDCEGFIKMGSQVVLAGPPTMMPKGIESLGAQVAPTVEAAVADADVIIMLRIQKERQKQFSMATEREYARHFGLNRQRLALAKKDVVIMHPGPINRGVEISPEVADGPGSIILEQVTNGVAVRMAMLYLVLGGGRNADAD